MPDDHWSSGGDDRGRASTSFCCRGVVGGPLTLRGRYAEGGRPMTTGALEVTTLQLCYDGGGGGGGGEGGARGPLTFRGRTL